MVDATNYVLLELGQPLHAFDLGRLQESTIVVRRAREGELIRTLDGESRRLRADMLAICDAADPVAIAGVMGGLESEVTGGDHRHSDRMRPFLSDVRPGHAARIGHVHGRELPIRAGGGSRRAWSERCPERWRSSWRRPGGPPTRRYSMCAHAPGRGRWFPFGPLGSGEYWVSSSQRGRSWSSSPLSGSGLGMVPERPWMCRSRVSELRCSEGGGRP